MRETVAVGRGTEVLARKCAWCGEWFGPEDKQAHERGALITHGCCAKCVEKYNKADQ